MANKSTAQPQSDESKMAILKAMFSLYQQLMKSRVIPLMPLTQCQLQKHHETCKESVLKEFIEKGLVQSQALPHLNVCCCVELFELVLLPCVFACLTKD